MYIDSTTSKYFLNNILNNNKIDFKKKEIAKYKKEIHKLVNEYKAFKKKNLVIQIFFLRLIKKIQYKKFQLKE